MAITDDVRKSLTDPTPLYFMAGTADLAAQKLKEVPALVDKIRAEAPERIAAVRNTDPQAVQDLVTQQAKDAQEKLVELLGSLDTDLKKVRDTAQDLALQGVGRAVELVVKARETYEEVAEHGRETVRNWRGEPEEATESAASRPAQPPADSGSTAGSGASTAGSGATTTGSGTAPAGGAANGSAGANGTASAAGGSTQPRAAAAAAKPAAKKPAPGRKPAAKKPGAKAGE
ncbi:hypothetical protein LRS74_18025 [Streptomyces sp. LX-29]|uniref:hypothetical protein n=1 Tax=Streptomyces sp. LX-29 TaxID=2900152 RepID=UPI00240DE6CB|nr:hypothetical protein [Streptomyces sp. LX-29]WFB08727.1 hypothetical protein LRS74_18025 [Streptomyces sp. LX-29]